jgi:hypothetical protein
MIAWLRRLLARLIPTSLAGRAAALIALANGILFVTASLFYIFGWGFEEYWDEWWPGRILGTLVFWIILPNIAYFGIRYWNRVEDSLYPDIDEAWRGGIEALRNAGMSIDSAPLFLVLGGSDVEDAFVSAMRAGGLAFRVERAPTAAGIAPALRWYASDSAIYLLSPRVGALSSLSQSWASSSVRSNTSSSAWSTRQVVSPVRQFSSRAAYQPVQTITPWDLPEELEPAAEAIWQAPVGEQSTGRLSTDVNIDQERRRLRYLCGLLRRARRPLCGINGAVTLLPYEMTEANGPELQAIIDSVHADTHAIRQVLWLRYPVTGLVVGMERVDGFDQFVRSLGANHLARRLGAGFDIRRLATRERLQRLSDRICDAFEDFIYILFEKPEALWQERDNRKLYGLLCRVRERLKPKLNTVLAKAFGATCGGETGSASGGRDTSPALFSGCYLAATGHGAEQQAFIKGVLFDKLVHEQARVEWTDEARRSHSLFQLAVWVGWVVVGVLAVLLVLDQASLG